MPSRRVRFAAFEFDRESGELRKHGINMRLQEQPYRILFALLEVPGEIVTREQLQQRLWGNETHVDFDRGLSAAMRRLRDVLGDSAESPRYIETVARRGYRFIAPIEEAPPPAGMAPVPASRLPKWPAALIGLCLIVAALGWYNRPRATPPAVLTQVTALTGSETMPSFSPDGAQLAYVWNGEREENADIYVRMVDGDAALRLTNHPGADLLPSWSPDGKSIAFVRVDKTTAVYVVSPLGGPERKLIEFPGLDGRPAGPESRIVGDLLYPFVNRPSWTPDSRAIAITRRNEPAQRGDGSVIVVPVAGGEPRTLLGASDGTWYKHATFSPDGQWLAAAVNEGPGDTAEQCEVRIYRLAKGLRIEGQPRALFTGCQSIRGLIWWRDSILFSGFRLPHFFLWRVAAVNPGPPERMELAGADAHWPSVSPSGTRLAFSRGFVQADLWRLQTGGVAAPFLSSTARDTSPAFSADGRRIAFQSARGGVNDIWMADADGSNPAPVTRRIGETTGSPAWHPSGREIAFDSNSKDGGTEIWITSVDGGPPQQLTKGPGHNAIPSFSRDGAFLYFHSDRSGSHEIWRIPSRGGEARRITHNGGLRAVESVDGKTLFYTKTDEGVGGIFALPLAGGAERNVVPDTIVRRAFAVAATGVYYIAPRNENFCELRFRAFAGKASRSIALIPRPIAFGLTVSPDEKTFVFSRPVTGADLMLIDNFRE